MIGCEAWAIKAPDDKLLASFIGSTKNNAIASITGLNPWVFYTRQGYRCVRVKIEEVAE